MLIRDLWKVDAVNPELTPEEIAALNKTEKTIYPREMFSDWEKKPKPQK